MAALCSPALVTTRWLGFRRIWRGTGEGAQRPPVPACWPSGPCSLHGRARRGPQAACQGLAVCSHNMHHPFCCATPVAIRPLPVGLLLLSRGPTCASVQPLPPLPAVFDTVDLFVPDVQFETQAAYLRLPRHVRQRLKEAGKLHRAVVGPLLVEGGEKVHAGRCLDASTAVGTRAHSLAVHRLGGSWRGVCSPSCHRSAGVPAF